MLCQALELLSGSNLLTQQNFEVIAEHAKPFECARAFDVLTKSWRSSDENYFEVQKHAQPFQLACAFNILWQVGCSQEQIKAVSSLANPSLFVETCEHLKRHYLDLFVRENIDTLLAAAMSQDPSNLNREANRIIQAYRAQNQVEFNPPQSTHMSSVHKSISASARNLNSRYGKDLDVAATIDKMREEVRTKGDEKAIACFERITGDGFNFEDEGSGVTVHRLLALAFKAFSDEENLIATHDDAFDLFLQGLREIQRGGNLDRVGTDNLKEDSPICASGTFNKVLEKLNYIHKDVAILYITQAGASEKLPPLARKHALQYLEQLAAKEMNHAQKLIKAMDDEGTLGPVWAEICEKVQKELWEEFQDAFPGSETEKFSVLIECGKDSEAPTQDELSQVILRVQSSLVLRQGMFQTPSQNSEKDVPKSSPS